MITALKKGGARCDGGGESGMSKCLVKTIPDTMTFLNREEDLEIPGLRKAKSEWAPCAKNGKGWVTVK